MDSRVMLCALCATLLLACTTIQSWFYQPPVRLPAPASHLPEPVWDAGTPSAPAWFEGPVLRALSLAVADLAGHVNPHTEDPLARCLARTDSYDAQVVREEADRWVIYVRPRAERCWDGGQQLKDGDATYEVSKGDFRLLSAEYGW